MAIQHRSNFLGTEILYQNKQFRHTKSGPHFEKIHTFLIFGKKFDSTGYYGKSFLKI